VSPNASVVLWLVHRSFVLGLAMSLLLLSGCGGGSSSSSSSTPSSNGVSSSGSVPSSDSLRSPYTVLTGPNVQPVSVSGDFAYGYINDVLTSVTVCVPGTTMCQTIPDILVDTGSSGLRLIASRLQLALPAVTSRGTPLGECLEFVDSYVWGPVVTADVVIADEQAAAVPIQLLGSPEFAGPPSLCSSSGLPETDTVESFGANGILGVGLFAYDCGTACTSQGPLEPPAIYFSCPSTSAPCTPTAVPSASQVQNPVWLFRQDNNGVIISLPPIDASGASSVAGTLVFGIGTAANNGLGNAQVYTTDAFGHFITLYKEIAYPGSYLDTGTSVLSILAPGILGIPLCVASTAAGGDYCPSTIVSDTATTLGANGATGTVAFRIANANTLVNSINWAFDDLAAPFQSHPVAFVWGLPFFFGRNVFVAIEGQNTPAGVGPYWAY
jgi:hypothetical protein